MPVGRIPTAAVALLMKTISKGGLEDFFADLINSLFES